MQQNSIIEINNLSCSYSLNADEKVLFIENLSLQRGKVIFLLGSSGSGKSTLLETLGLMNNTVAGGSINFFPDDQSQFEYAQLWAHNDSARIENIRKNFLSFIFQSTNLMENFSAYENICVSQMIKANVEQSKAMGEAVKLMQQVGLNESEVGYNTLSVNLSGGQRQRVSFVRALNANYNLLLCDEPTGNLDEINAHELISIIKQNITSEKTAIIVSHDINLALRYADQIILIGKNKHSYGEILSENIYESEYWKSLDKDALVKFREKLLKHFNIDSSSNKRNHKTSKNPELFSDYRNMFIKKEGQVLYGKSFSNLIVLSAIIFITLIAMGFANGALQYLDTKLNDRFVNWLTIGIPWAHSNPETVQAYTDELNSKQVTSRYKIDTVTAYKQTLLPLFPAGSQANDYTRGRLISVDDPLKTALFDSTNGNRVSGHFFNDENDLGIVVTEKLLSRLKYPVDAKVIYLDYDNIDTTQNPPAHFRVPIPVRGVLKEIPGRNYFLITNFFYSSYVSNENCVFDFKVQGKRIVFYLDGDKTFADSFIKSIQSIKDNFDLNDISYAEDAQVKDRFDETISDEDTQPVSGSDSTDQDSSLVSNISVEKLEIDIRKEDLCESINEPGFEVSVNFDALPKNYAVTENIYKQISATEFYKKNSDKIIRIFDFGIAQQIEPDYKNDYLCINFKQGQGGLDSVESFAKYLTNAFNKGTDKDQSNIIEFDSGSIKEKKNFNYISKVTLLIALLLIIFAIVAISLFISNLLKTHLTKVKMNLGTFKAFGLKDNESKTIYLTIMLRFIFIGLISSFAVAYLIGIILNKFLQSYYNFDDNLNYFNLFDSLTFMLILIVIIVTIAVSYLNINRILSKTPGDLIYNR